MKKIVSSLAVAALSCAVNAAELGLLRVTSAVGEPFSARLEIKDVDPSVQPLLIRLAPSATYTRVGKAMLTQSKDFDLSLLSQEPYTVAITSKESVSTEQFPLIVEMSVAGKASARLYTVKLVSKAQAAKTESAAKPAVQQKTSEAQKPVVEAAVKKSEAVAKTAAKKIVDTKNLTPVTLPLNPADYNLEEGVLVRPGMTLWSIARLFKPEFPQATMDEVIVGLVRTNPECFKGGAVSGLRQGCVLEKPTQKTIDEIDALQTTAFVRMNSSLDATKPLSAKNRARAIEVLKKSPSAYKQWLEEEKLRAKTKTETAKPAAPATKPETAKPVAKPSVAPAVATATKQEAVHAKVEPVVKSAETTAASNVDPVKNEPVQAKESEKTTKQEVKPSAEPQPAKASDTTVAAQDTQQSGVGAKSADGAAKAVAPANSSETASESAEKPSEASQLTEMELSSSSKSEEKAVDKTVAEKASEAKTDEPKVTAVAKVESATVEKADSIGWSWLYWLLGLLGISAAGAYCWMNRFDLGKKFGLIKVDQEARANVVAFTKKADKEPVSKEQLDGVTTMVGNRLAADEAAKRGFPEVRKEPKLPDLVEPVVTANEQAEEKTQVEVPEVAFKAETKGKYHGIGVAGMSYGQVNTRWKNPEQTDGYLSSAVCAPGYDEAQRRARRDVAAPESSSGYENRNS